MATTECPQFSTEAMIQFAAVLRRFQEREAAARVARERLAVAFGELTSPVTDDDVRAFAAPVEASHAG